MSDVEFFAAAAVSGWLLVPVVYCLGFWLGGRYALNARRKLQYAPWQYARVKPKLYASIHTRDPEDIN